MKRISLLLAAALIASPALNATPPPGYKLEWSDEFDGTKLDTTKWVHWGPGKRRSAINVPEAVTVRDGVLTITTYTENGKHYTGMVSTDKLFERRYGYWEARIKWADAPGTFSAFWTWTWTMGKPVGDVANAGVEIDFVEHRAFGPQMKNIADMACFTIHYDGYDKKYHKRKSHVSPPLGLGEGFHLYGCKWTEDSYSFYLDDKLIWTENDPKTISKKPQFMILSTEIGAPNWTAPVPKEGYGDHASSKVKMIVDYARWYAGPDSSGPPAAKKEEGARPQPAGKPVR